MGWTEEERERTQAKWRVIVRAGVGGDLHLTLRKRDRVANTVGRHLWCCRVDGDDTTVSGDVGGGGLSWVVTAWIE
jgi:hypothetical protein